MKDTWQKYWSEDAEFVQVFTDKQGNKNQSLVNHWDAVFSKLNDDACVLDLASGASSLFRDYENSQRLKCMANDISETALERLKRDLPYVETICAPIEKIKIQENSVDLLCSQFGFEYAGIESIQHLARLMKPQGTIQLISHYTGGYIDRNTQNSLTAINVLNETLFLQKSKKVASAFHEDNRSKVELAVQTFMQIEPTISALCREIPNGQHVHIYNSVKELLSNFNRYNYQSIEAWFADTESQMVENESRLSSMHKACLDSKAIKTLEGLCKKNNIVSFSATPFYLDNNSQPIAWNIYGQKR